MDEGVDDADLIVQILGGQYLFIRTDDTCDGAPIYVLEEDFGGDSDEEIVLYRMPSGMFYQGNFPGMFWVVRLGHNHLAYGVDRRASGMRSDPCFFQPDGSCGWFIGDYTAMRETDTEAPDLSLVNALPEHRATRAAIEVEHEHGE